MSALKSELDAPVVQLRASEAQLSRTVAALEAGGVWSGDDATAFQSAWADGVHRPLVIATVSLEALHFVPMA